MDPDNFTPEDAAVERAEAFADEFGWSTHRQLPPHALELLGEMTNPADIASGDCW